MRQFVYISMLLASVSLTVAADKASNSDDDDIREIVLRAMFKDVSASEGIRVFFISAEEWGTDPSEAFMARFANDKPPVRKVSASAKKNGKVFDKGTGERGIIFSVDLLKRKSDMEVQIRGNVHRADLNGYAETYTLTNKDGKWKITNKKLDSIS